MTDTCVLYNGSCPICAREIRHYEKLATAGDLPMQFDALQDSAATWGITPDAAARQIHVRRGDEILVGYEAFIALWAAIPRYRWLAKFCSLPVIRTIVKFIYDRLAAPLLYTMHKRREKRTA